MFVAVAAEDNNTRVLFERVLSSGALSPDKSRLAMFLLLLLTYHLSKKICSQELLRNVVFVSS